MWVLDAEYKATEMAVLAACVDRWQAFLINILLQLHVYDRPALRHVSWTLHWGEGE